LEQGKQQKTFQRNGNGTVLLQESENELCAQGNFPNAIHGLSPLLTMLLAGTIDVLRVYSQWLAIELTQGLGLICKSHKLLNAK
jgi:hypothetical protein